LKKLGIVERSTVPVFRFTCPLYTNCIYF